MGSFTYNVTMTLGADALARSARGSLRDYSSRCANRCSYCSSAWARCRSFGDEVRDGVAIFVIILAVASIRRARAQTIALAPLSDSETAEFRRLLPSDLADWRTSTPT